MAAAPYTYVNSATPSVLPDELYSKKPSVMQEFNQKSQEAGLGVTKTWEGIITETEGGISVIEINNGLGQPIDWALDEPGVLMGVVDELFTTPGGVLIGGSAAIGIIDNGGVIITSDDPLTNAYVKIILTSIVEAESPA
jgi:Ethanolamine utilization protein EutJ (predicted chaperonin)